MTYIINPIWFYLMYIVDALREVCIVCLVICPLSAGFSAFYTTECSIDDEKKWWKAAKKFGIATIVLTFLVVLIPSKETFMQIMIAKYATYENADNVIQAIKSAADYVIEAAGKLQ